MSDTFPCTLDRVQWAAIGDMLGRFACPESLALQIQIRDGLRSPRAAQGSRFRLLQNIEHEWFLVPDGFESEFRKKDLDGEDLCEYYSPVPDTEALTFTAPVERH